MPPTLLHPIGTILAEYDALNEEWAFRVVGCPCVRPDGSTRHRHALLSEAEACAMRVRKGSGEIRLAPSRRPV